MTTTTKVETAINLIGRAPRALAPADFPVGYAITNSWMAALAAGTLLEGHALERTMVIALDADYRCIAGVVVAAGRLQASRLTAERVFAALRDVRAHRFILARRRLAGIAVPTVSERLVASALHAAGERLGIAMMDHVVIGRPGRYYSLAETAHAPG